jgi:hemolysin activation/secretion protein
MKPPRRCRRPIFEDLLLVWDMAPGINYKTRLLLAIAGLAAQTSLAAGVPEEPRFDITRYEVNGNSVLDAAALSATLAPHVGSGRRFADVEAARQSLLAAYAKAGYGTVRVALPEQEITQGVVRLEVQENRVGVVTLLGAQHHDAANLRASVPDLREGAVPNTVRVAEDLRLANDNPSKQTQVMFKNGSQPGQVDALVRVEDVKPTKTFLTLDNSGNDATGEARLGVGWQHANLFNSDQVLTLQYVTSPSQPADVAIYGLGWHLPLYQRGDAIDVHAGYSNVDSGTVADLFQVSGKGVLAGAVYTVNFTKHSAVEQRLLLGLDYRAFRDAVVDGLGNQLGYDVTVHPLSLALAGQWQSNNAHAAWQAGVSHNIPGGSHGGDAAFATARVGAVADYSILRLGGSYARTFAGDWQASFAADAQYSDKPLIPGEQFGLGGQASVRGFGERAVFGDRGWRAGIEVNGPDLGPGLVLAGSRLRLAGFLEGGSARRLQAQAGEPEQIGIASVGVGLRFAWRHSADSNLSARIDYGYVLDGGADQRPGDGRLHVALNWTF